MTDTTVYPFDDIATALKDMRMQIQANAEVLQWSGPTDLHVSLMASGFPPNWHFSEAGLEYHAEHGRDRWDVFMFVAFQLGMHNGLASQEKELERLNTRIDRQDQLINQILTAKA